MVGGAMRASTFKSFPNFGRGFDSHRLLQTRVPKANIKKSYSGIYRTLKPSCGSNALSRSWEGAGSTELALHLLYSSPLKTDIDNFPFVSW